MNDHIFLEYIFVFRPGETWGNIKEFEKTLSDHLDNVGLVGENIPSLANPNKKLVFIRKKAPEPVEIPEPKPTPIAQQQKNLIKNRPRA